MRCVPPSRSASSPATLTSIGDTGSAPDSSFPDGKRLLFSRRPGVPFGRQTGLSVGLDSRGTVTEETYDASGALLSRTTAPFAKMFVIRRATGGRWLNVAVLPPKDGG